MPRRSAGILLWRRGAGGVEVLLAHPGGPLWARRDQWGVPKGEHDADEPAWDAARREWTEETSTPVPPGEPLDLGEVVQRGGKRVVAFAVEGDADPAALRSNDFELEWPPRSGRVQRFPEVDRFAWFDLATAATKVPAAQQPLLDRLAGHVGRDGEPS